MEWFCSGGKKKKDMVGSKEDDKFAKVMENVAFSIGQENDDLICASYRIPFKTKDGAILNIERFLPADKEQKQERRSKVLYVPGVCESAETWAVQYLARAAIERGYSLDVLELEGHGLSTGKRALCGNFSKAHRHVVEFVHHSILTAKEEEEEERGGVPFFLTGSSLGGVLAAYASETIAASDSDLSKQFLGAALLCPAVGVHSDAVPSPMILMALRLVAFLAPSSNLSMTPLEEPSHYNCPKSTTRNYEGYWPLATSKMLLDLSTSMVKTDMQTQNETHQNGFMGHLPAVLVISAENDDVVPPSCVKQFFDGIRISQKEYRLVSGGDHSVLQNASKAQKALDILFSWLDRQSVPSS